MAKCAVCGKGAHFGNNVSHSHRRSNRMWKSNIKSVKCSVNGTPKKLYVCTSCLRSGKVERISSQRNCRKTVPFFIYSKTVENHNTSILLPDIVLSNPG